MFSKKERFRNTEQSLPRKSRLPHFSRESCGKYSPRTARFLQFALENLSPLVRNPLISMQYLQFQVVCWPWKNPWRFKFSRPIRFEILGCPPITFHLFKLYRCSNCIAYNRSSTVSFTRIWRDWYNCFKFLLKFLLFKPVLFKVMEAIALVEHLWELTANPQNRATIVKVK